MMRITARRRRSGGQGGGDEGGQPLSQFSGASQQNTYSHEVLAGELSQSQAVFWQLLGSYVIPLLGLIPAGMLILAHRRRVHAAEQVGDISRTKSAQSVA